MAVTIGTDEPSTSTAGGPAHPVVSGLLRGSTLVWVLAAFIAAAATSLTAGEHGSGPIEGGLSVPWWVLVVAFALAEVFVVHLTFRRHSLTFSLCEVPIALTFGAFSPVVAVLIRLIGSSIGLASKRVRGVKLAFNLASAALETIAATLVYCAVIGNHGPFTTRGWVAILAASLAVDLVSGITIFTAMSLVDGRFDPSVTPEIALTGVVAATVNACLSIITLIVLKTDPYAGIALAVIALIVLTAYRAWIVQSRRHARVQMLYEFTRSLDSEQLSTTGDVIAHTLREAREIANAQTAEIFLADFEDGGPTRFWLHPDGTLGLDRPGLRPGWWSQIALDNSVRWSKGRRVHHHDLASTPVGLADGVVVPLRSPRHRHGLLLVAERADDVSTFTEEDLRLLETLASTVAVEFDNVQLVEELRREAAEKAHQALHDPLTGLPNRRAFGLELGEALRSGRPTSVLLMDLDRFKEVNDSLGHAAGDRLLRAVSDHLRRALGDDNLIARFGGDEFAVLLAVDEPTAVADVAHHLLRALEIPIDVEHLAIELGASIGGAIYPSHGDDPDQLIQHADVAMYAAKEQLTGFELYSPERDVSDVRRLGLVVELRRAISEGRLHLEYQPKLELASNRIIGVEALVRWSDAKYGRVTPDEFIPLAECTGLIGPLTDFVLARALADCTSWSERGTPIGVAVNISARSLVDADLPAMVARRLVEFAVPPGMLTLEITEGCIMREPDRNIALLGRLRDLGVRLSIDDFGTGYSSLAYIKRLPVHEVKVDRMFMAGLDTDAGSRAIVGAATKLTHDLGLSLVAEGVETAAALDTLGIIGADIAQGYYIGRPMRAHCIDDVLAEQASAGEWGRPGTPAGPGQVGVASVTSRNYPEAAIRLAS